jgi:hypothetical protein
VKTWICKKKLYCDILEDGTPKCATKGFPILAVEIYAKEHDLTVPQVFKKIYKGEEVEIDILKAKPSFIICPGHITSRTKFCRIIKL